MWICYYTDITNELTTRLTNISIASARKHMPDVKVLFIYPDWHLLNPEIGKHVDHMYPIMNLPKGVHWDYRRCLANAEVTGECLFIDTDTVFQHDVSNVWTHPFDVAATLREKPFEAQIPYNMGVCFSRTPRFWKHVALQIPKASNHWRDSELAFSKTAMITSEYTVRQLPGHLYNKTPETKGESVSHAYIVHYKGVVRKPWMLAREKEFIE